MGDLISRSALIEEIDTQLNEIKETEGMTTYVILLTSICEKFKKLIKRIPIAYSVEKVVAELEEKENEAVLKAPNTSDISNAEYQKWMMKSYGFKETIDIVRKGGVESE